MTRYTNVLFLLTYLGVRQRVRQYAAGDVAAVAAASRFETFLVPVTQAVLPGKRGR